VIAIRGQPLPEPDPALYLIEEDKIGKRPADVEAQLQWQVSSSSAPEFIRMTCRRRTWRGDGNRLDTCFALV
jgi:hypothetical protein